MYSWEFVTNFPFPKNGGHFEISNFAKNGKTQICFSLLTVRDRAISSKFSTHRVSDQYTRGNFQKIFPSPKMASMAILNFCQKWQNSNLFLSPKPCDIEQFCRNFRPTGYQGNVLLGICKKVSPPQKW